MADTSFAVSAGAGTNLHTVSTSIGGTTVHDQVVKLGEPYLATYAVATTTSVSLATASTHVIQLMAGSTLNVYVHRIQVYQSGLATTAAFAGWGLLRLTTAGTGGTVVVPAPLDTTDAASGATAATAPTTQGTEGVRIGTYSTQIIQTVGTGGPGLNPLLLDLVFDGPTYKVPRIPAGTANGLALKCFTAVAGGTVNVVATISEANF